jgi:hypothetical protein
MRLNADAVDDYVVIEAGNLISLNIRGGGVHTIRATTEPGFSKRSRVSAQSRYQIYLMNLIGLNY